MNNIYILPYDTMNELITSPPQKQLQIWRNLCVYWDITIESVRMISERAFTATRIVHEYPIIGLA